MKTIVVYNSKTGFTKRYAKWIQDTLDCEIKSYKDMKNANWQAYDLIIYGSRIMAGKIKDLDKVKKMVSGHLVVFAVGIAPAIYACDKIKNDNFDIAEQETIPFYYFEGGIDYDKLGFPSQKLLKMIGSSLKKKDNKTEEDMEMIELLEKSSDQTNKEYIQPLINKIKAEFL